MTRADYRSMLRTQGRVWCDYTYRFDWRNLPFWAIAELHDYLMEG